MGAKRPNASEFGFEYGGISLTLIAFKSKSSVSLRAERVRRSGSRDEHSAWSGMFGNPIASHSGGRFGRRNYGDRDKGLAPLSLCESR
jgi:hypothetical protein